jgi:Zn-dependent peptidase ImmA (M78 family)
MKIVKPSIYGKAIDIRKKLDIPLNSPIDIIEVCRDLSISILFKNIAGNETISGLCKKKSNHKFIMVNSNNCLAHQYLTLAHELYHLLFEDNNKGMHICSKFAKEKNADIFAGYLLLPPTALKKYWDVSDKNYQSVFEISQKFKVSYQAVIVNLRFRIKIIDYHKYNELDIDDIIYNAEKLNYNTDLYRSTNRNELISDYQKDVDWLFDKKIIYESKYNELKDILD